jgi:asparagine synthase (glutamine-hydrolysing)
MGVCGIAGKVSPSGQVDQGLIERMCAVIEHRGPDSRGLFLADGVALGIQRLRIIDLETGDQPIFNEDGSIVVVLNGEIYNYKELRSDLQKRGHTLATQGDTEVIAHLYEDFGLACVRHLRGMFAFALWDTRRRQLLLARDRVGKKPLFYSFANGTLWFGSEAKSILQDSAIERQADFDAIDCFLHLDYVPDPLSAFRGVSKLPPAHTLLWREGTVEIARYWRLSYRRGSIASEQEAHETIRAELLEATRLRLRSDVPLGAFLSGGVDSSAVVAAMARQHRRVKTYSIGFDVETYDETRYAREVARLYDTDHEELRVEPSAIEVLPRLVWHYGEPFADDSAIPTFYLAELTRRHVTVALSGDGGDENFAGYPRHVGSAFTERVARFPRPARVLLATAADVLGPDNRANSFRSRFHRVTHTALASTEDRYANWFAGFDRTERDRLYTPEFRASLGERFARDVFANAHRQSDAEDYVNRMLDVDVQTYLASDLLVKMDIASMAHSLEVRSPLLDHVFMEMAAGLPGGWKLKGRTTKKVFKDALRPWLPDHLLRRRKQGFGVPLDAWFRGRLKTLPGELLLDPRTLGRGLFREQRLRQIINEHIDGVRDRQKQIWALIQLELWLRTFIDGDASEPITLDTSYARSA